MLSIGKLAADPASYYAETHRRGADEYYTGARGEVPGRWTGRSAARLGLQGRVTPGQLTAILDGHIPDGVRLIGRQGRERNPGFDCTFSLPKEASVMYAVGPQYVRRAILAAHEATVDTSLKVLEHEVARARRGRGGVTSVEGEGLVAAAFRHRTSREGDPQIHTHVLVANLVYSPCDGRWTAIDGRLLYAWAKAVGYLYEAQLRIEVTRRLGVSWGPTKNGIAAIEGIPKNVVKAFSKRRQQITERMDATGTSGAKAAQAATYATRKPKDTTVSIDELFETWRATALNLGFDEESVMAALDRSDEPRPIAPDSADARLMFTQLALASGLTEKRSTFNRRDVIMHICDRLPAGADVQDVLALADAFLQSREVVPLSAGVSDTIRRKDGTAAPIPTDPSSYTTREMLQAEKALLRLVASRRAAGAGLAAAAAVESALTSRPTTTPEQAEMVRRACLSGTGVDIVEGLAGSGKTFALEAAHDAWTASGFTVVGASLAARAARNLEAATGIRSSTLHRLLADLARPESGGLGPRHVVVVDEAAMVGTRNLLTLVQRAHRANAKVVLIGDPCQLPEIDAGGAFAALSQQERRTALTVNRRQVEGWERQALWDLRSGCADDALTAYIAHNRLHHHDDPDTLRESLVVDWWSSVAEKRRSVMLALHRHEVDDLNGRARLRMRAAGRLAIKEWTIGNGCYSVGDTVLAHRNDHREHIVNGDRGEITAIDEEAHRIEVALEDGSTVNVPFAYAEAGHLTHGYATTIHKTQGRTIDAAIVLVHPSMSREQLYSAMSRGRLRNEMYVTGDEARAEVAHVAEARPEPEDLVRRVMQRSSAESLAVDSLGVGL